MSAVGCQNTFDVNEIMSVMPGNMLSSLKLLSWAGHVLLRCSVFPPAFMEMEGSGRLVLISLIRAHLYPLREGLDVLMVLSSLSLCVHIKYDTKLNMKLNSKPCGLAVFCFRESGEMGSLERGGRDPEEPQLQGFSASLFLCLSWCGDLEAVGRGA